MSKMHRRSLEFGGGVISMLKLLKCTFRLLNLLIDIAEVQISINHVKLLAWLAHVDLTCGS